MNSLTRPAVWAVTQHVTDEEWSRIARKLGGGAGMRARKGGSTRRFVNAVIWVARTRACWTDIPADFGNAHTIYVRFLRWIQDGQWFVVMSALDEGAIKEDMCRMLEMHLNRAAARDQRRENLAKPQLMIS